jgi:hypothetical protein
MLAQQECRTRPVAGRCWNFWETQRLVFVDSMWKKKRHWTEGTQRNHRCWLIAVWFSSVGRSHFSLVCRGEKSRLHLKSCCCYYFCIHYRFVLFCLCAVSFTHLRAHSSWKSSWSVWLVLGRPCPETKRTRIVAEQQFNCSLLFFLHPSTSKLFPLLFEFEFKKKKKPKMFGCYREPGDWQRAVTAP